MAVKKSSSPLAAVAGVLVIIFSAVTGFLAAHRHDAGVLVAAIALALAIGVGLKWALARQRPAKQD